ncbi:hypothetical protein KIN20_003909 [Parelaphostrongylus tenuis]|uniref:Uncharacterized protein n=1 Tax=Parelaphostrongylus tenuis TaxID=148309 RepID=A0AAD5MGF8_PARTN|nr:hypothetical protein KIN20_003909 [Parelaphostrongylus tenuis]
MLCAIVLLLLVVVFSVVTPGLKEGSGEFTVTFSSMETFYASLCYTEWPSSASQFLDSSCLFHPKPYAFTIHPGFPFKIGRPLRDIVSDYIAVIINVTSNGGNHYGIRERLLVDGSLPNRSITMRAGLLTIDFAIICEMCD